MQYSLRNGLYIRPNSPINQEPNEYTQRVVTNRHIPIALQPPATRLNNTASSSFLVPGSYEEEKKLENPLPTPIEEYK